MDLQQLLEGVEVQVTIKPDTNSVWAGKTGKLHAKLGKFILVELEEPGYKAILKFDRSEVDVDHSEGGNNDGV